MLFGPRQPNDKVHVDVFQHPIRNINDFCQATRSLVFKFDLLASCRLEHKLTYVFLHYIPLVISLNSIYIMVVSGWIEYEAFWASCMVNLFNSLLLGAHNVPWYHSTTSPPYEKTSTCSSFTKVLNLNKAELRCCLSLTSSIKEDADLYCTTTFRLTQFHSQSKKLMNIFG